MRTFISFLVISVFSLVLIGCGHIYSSMESGQKTLLEIKETKNTLLDQISDYEGKINRLNEANIEMERQRQQDSSQSNLALSYRASQNIRDNDSLIRFYQVKILELSGSINSMLSNVSRTEKDQIMLKGDVREVAGAYLSIKSLNQGTQDSLIGVVENANPDVDIVIVEVKNFSGFHVTFTLDNQLNKKSPEFALPVYGDYTIIFTGQGRHAGQVSQTTERVAPGTVYYGGNRRYALKSTLRP